MLGGGRRGNAVCRHESRENWVSLSVTEISTMEKSVHKPCSFSEFYVAFQNSQSK